MELERINPPKLANRFFRWYCRADRYEELSGDLEELFQHRLKSSGRNSAVFIYYWNVLKCCKPYAWKATYVTETSGALLFSIWKIGYRNLWKNKWTMLINVVGLAFALALSIITYMLSAYNREFDQRFASRDDLYRIHAIQLEDDRLQRFELIPESFSESLKLDLSFIKNKISLYPSSLYLSHGDGFVKGEAAFVSSNFPVVFDTKFLKGNPDYWPKEGIILTKSLAEKLFPRTDPLGEVIQVFQYENELGEVIVTGVIEDAAVNSSYNYELLIHLELLKNLMQKEDSTAQSRFQTIQFVELKSPAYKPELRKYFQAQINRYNKINPARPISMVDLAPYYKPAINQPFLRYANAPHALDEILLFTLIAGMILIITCINIAITQSTLVSTRLKEIGVRKVLGSHKPQITLQFLLEMFFMVLFAGALALPLINILGTEVWNLFHQADLLISDLRIDHFFLFLLLFVFIITGLTGIFPALRAKNFEPVNILNHKLKPLGSGKLHYTLLTMQFTISIVLIMCATAFINNVHYQKNRPFGYNSENVLLVKVSDSVEYNMLRNEVSKLNFVKSTFGTFHPLSGMSKRGRLITDNDSINLDVLEVGEKYLSEMGVKFQSGNDFHLSQAVKNPAIVNSIFERGYSSESSLLHQQIRLDGKKYSIVGITSSHHHWSMYSGIRKVPLVYILRPPNQMNYLCIRTHDVPKKEVENQIEIIYNESFNKPAFSFWQHEYTYTQAYEMAQGVKDLFVMLACISLVICVMGVIGIVRLRLDHLSKAISIRKVLGGNTREIFFTVNSPFIWSLFIAFVAGGLIGHYFSSILLEAMHFDWQLLPLFVEAAICLAVIGIILSILLIFSMKQINRNPAFGLRDE